jgi:formamidopyrimidine-DNA glycosylase
MPELPEVEVTRRGIDEPLRGARVQQLLMGKPLRWPLGIDPARLSGARIVQVDRRGKYLWLLFADAAGGLLIHLGMSGSLALRLSPGERGPHDHFDLVTNIGVLRLTDPRRFGAVVWSPSIHDDPARKLLSKLGAEPFDDTLDDAGFHTALRRHRSPIKAVLLSGAVVVGAGNIYACEALHIAGIDPRTPAQRLSRPRAARLLAAVRDTLRRAVELGGSTLRDFRDAHGMDGAFQSQALVYGREGQACARCGASVRRIVQAQRSTFFCGGCQRR